MRQSEEGRVPPPEDVGAREVWSRARAADAPDDEAARFLDLAAFAEERLDEDERERVAALIAGDRAAAEDVEVARVLGGVMDGPAVAVERVIGRALGLVPEPAERRIVPFGRPPRLRPVWDVAQWASVAAAVVLAGWLGFSMGSDTWLAYREAGQSVGEDNSYLPGLLDPSTGFLREIAEDLET